MTPHETNRLNRAIAEAEHRRNNGTHLDEYSDRPDIIAALELADRDVEFVLEGYDKLRAEIAQGADPGAIIECVRRFELLANNRAIRAKQVKEEIEQMIEEG
ncbi:MAG: hypothetical protein JNN26_19280 [Candidatus Obscuribacter sp.]|nr:hypothetical protein [Candidatus Obscuribacter sp.]